MEIVKYKGYDIEVTVTLNDETLKPIANSFGYDIVDSKHKKPINRTSLANFFGFQGADHEKSGLLDEARKTIDHLKQEVRT